MALYNDRVYAYELMQQLDPKLNDQADARTISDYLNAQERNILAFAELENYQSKGQFLFKHAILLQHKQRNELEKLKQHNPERFTRELINANRSIVRYKSLIKNKKYRSKAEQQSWLDHIENYQIKVKLMTAILSA
jgi:hypothetical protein